FRCAIIIVTELRGSHVSIPPESQQVKNCDIDIELNELDMGMHRRTWTALIDLAGLLGTEETEHDCTEIEENLEKDLTIKSMLVPFCVGSAVRVRSLRIDMNYPANSTRLGVIRLENAVVSSKLNLYQAQETLSICILVDGLRVDDRTPYYSELYPEKMILCDGNNVVPSHAEIRIVKFLGEDANRECDLRLSVTVPETMRLYYIHTHRYFCGLLDFWLHFNELQDQVAKVKRRNVIDGVRSKVALDLNVKCPTSVVFPLNQCSDQLLVLESEGVRLSNKFKRMSEMESEFQKNCIETDFGYDPSVDCLLDCLNVMLPEVSIYEGKRFMMANRKEDKTSRSLGREAFESFEIIMALDSVFSRRFDLSVDVFRNLDGILSHNAPDLSVVASISKLTWRITSDFYILFRGVLEKNFGDPLIPIPETIPMEILQKPTTGCVRFEVGCVNKYATLSFRLLFDNVELDCLVPQTSSHPPPTSLFGKPFTPFAKMQLHSARVSFDVFIDGQSELDLVCESANLIDTREVQLGSGTKNMFNTILRPRESSNKNYQLMSEAHIMMRKDEVPVVTLVLMYSRVLMFYDWLNDAKEFVMLSSDFVPKYSDDVGRTVVNGGVVGRMGRVPSGQQQTLALKITLRDSDLYLLENPSRSNSFAVVVNTSAVLNVSDPGGVMAFNLEIQKCIYFASGLQNMSISWCCMQNEEATLNQCSNEFSIAVSMAMNSSVTEDPNKRRGLPSLTQKRHMIEVYINGMIGRLSYKDVRVLRNAVDGYMENLKQNSGVTMIPVIGIPPKPKNIEIGRIMIKSERIDLWLLDDFQGSSIPLLRMSLLRYITDLSIDRQSEDRLVSNFSISADYFNQRVFGWEPMVEKWSVLRLLLTRKENTRNMDLIAESRSTLDINITEQLMQQAVQIASRWPLIRSSFERDDFRNSCARSRSDHLPYLFKNQTGCDVVFSTAVEDIQIARTTQRKASVRWISVAKDKEHTFEFPPRLLLYSHSEREPPRQLIVRVSGWDEISPVNVDACGTYFRLVKGVKRGIPMARVVIQVTMEKDGKKVVAIRSSIDVHNQLPHQLAIYSAEDKRELMIVDPIQTKPIPLPFAHCQFLMSPVGCQVLEKAEGSWLKVRAAGDTLNRTQRLETSDKNNHYWLCTAVRREHYPDQESLPGHSIFVVAPLTLQNLLPVDVEIHVVDKVFPIAAGKQLLITSVDITKPLSIRVVTDRLRTVQECYISKSSVGEGQLVSLRLHDASGRPLDMYGNVHIGTGGSISFSLWVPYWIVNKSGIPLILKQEAASSEAAGQMSEHERAKDRNPLMFSFADDGCPKQCVVRVGRGLAKEPYYVPRYSQKFALTPGVQALKLNVVHESLPTLYYNIGVEVRAGTGRYKDTQVVLLTPRYVISNQSSYAISVCHHDLIDRPSEHVHIASQCSLVWNENYEDCRQMCVRRSDVRHWSCPFRIDRIGSFHITMRDSDETPRFVRVEVILNSAVFCVTFTDAEYYPPPIRIDNQSDVPVLYQQQSEGPIGQHLRTICKARSHIDYAWDDLYGSRRIVLQVYENKSHVYDPSMPGIGPQLVYENNVYIQLASSFNDFNVTGNKKTDECELVLETMQKGKVMLNKQNRIDANNGNQLWVICRDGCIENVGMSHRSKTRTVLDVLERMGFQLMMTPRSSSRDRFQKWTLSPVRWKKLKMLAASKQIKYSFVGISIEVWQVQRQRPGSGTLEVECLHSGPTLVVRITDREDRMRTLSMPTMPKPTNSAGLEVNVTMRAGIGVSLVNGSHEELLYARFGGIVLSARRMDETYQLTGSVDVIQIDNQLLNSDKWQVLYCQPEVSGTARPALKLEMNCTPMKHYDAFDCFRLKLCDLDVQLDELLLWKLVQFAQATEAASSVQHRTLSLPPNTDLERTDPLRTRRWYFGTLDLEMGQISLSVVTVSKSSLPPECRQLKQQFNMKLVSFENAAVYLPPFRQFHYFETSSFLLESLQKFYFAELQKQTLNIVVTLDAFGNPQGLVTDLKDSFQGLFIEGNLQRFVAGLGYGVSNSISKVGVLELTLLPYIHPDPTTAFQLASSAASGVGALTFDQEHEAKRRHNMIRSHSTTTTPLSHLYSGVKGLGVGVLGGMTAIVTNTIAESRKSGIVTGAIRGITTGAVDTVTKPVQGLFDLVEGTASAMKELAGPATGSGRSRVRPPRLCRNLYHLLPPYSIQLANAQMEMMRINGYSTKERLLDVEVCLEQFKGDGLIRHYVLISTRQCYVCQQVNSEPSHVISRIPYKYLRNVQPRPELENSLASLEVILDTDDRRTRPSHVWCGRFEVARRLAEKVMRAKHEYDHSKRTLTGQDCMAALVLWDERAQRERRQEGVKYRLKSIQQQQNMQEYQEQKQRYEDYKKAHSL
ncbi:unnamed protein product, partial [Haemonchus placei]|uniref:SHR-BD domain-containing protein n=1 Tax=Haemonchus placei TaxID=6290 RepID=A0A158QP20_HAEPC